LIGKAILHAGDRATALSRSRALEQMRIEGVKTNVPALLRVLEEERFASGEYDTTLLGQ
jgi:acetyl-CoA carboxylase biotin carboxylase subunit